jgi:tetratricopeptide (TPR) repeat protein
VDKERENLQKAWKGRKQKVEVVSLERGGLEGIRQALLAEPFHILHFMGHGTFDTERAEGWVLFEGEDGRDQPFEGRQLADLLHDFASLRLVVLNACCTADAVGRHGPNPFAGVASALVMGGVPAVVAMNGPIPDRAAVAFSRTFYQRLAAGDSVEAAVAEGRLAIQRAEPAGRAWATPVLFLRGPDGRLFAPRSTVWARRVAIITLFAVALVLLLLLFLGWMREHRSGEVTRRTNDGVGFLELGRKDDARKALRSALDLDPDNAVVLGNLSIVEMQLGNLDAALSYSERAAAAAPDEAVHQYNLGSLMALRKRPEEAIAHLRRAIELDPGYGFAYNELGNVYLDLDRPAEARKAFEAGLRCDPNSGKAYKNLGRLALAEEHPEEAVLHLKKALSLLSPFDSLEKAEATYWLAEADAKTGQGVEACSALHDFRVLDPELLSPFVRDAKSLAEQQGCSQWP